MPKDKGYNSSNTSRKGLASFPPPKNPSSKKENVPGAIASSEGTGSNLTKIEKGSFITSRAKGVKNIGVGTSKAGGR